MVHICIVNSKLVKQDYAQNLREILSEIPGLEYYVFSTHSKGHEKSITQTVIRTFNADKIRIYVIGGTGTFHNVINSIDDISKVEVAWIPAYANRFIDNICEDSSNFYDVLKTVKGKSVPVDLLNVNGVYAISEVAMGIDSDLLTFADKARNLGLLGAKIPYTLGLLHSILISKNNSYEVELDNNSYSGKATEVFFGNGCALGNGLIFGLNADITDGIASYRVIYDTITSYRPDIIKALLKDDRTTLEAISSFGFSKSMKVRRTNGCSFLVNVDGDLMEAKEFSVKVEPGKLNLVLPEGTLL